MVNNQKDLLIIQGFKTFLPDNTYIDKCFTDQLYNSSEIYKTFQDLNINRCGYPFAKLYNTEIIHQNHIRFIESIHYAEDVMFMLTYLCHCSAIQTINGMNYNYYVRKNVKSLSIRIFSFEALSRKKDAGADPDIKEYVKGQRKLFKDYIGRLNDKIFLKDDEGIFADMQGAGIQIRTLLKVAKVYAKRVSEVKREKGIIDFNDMEHLALSILVKKEDGKLVYTETADKLAH